MTGSAAELFAEGRLQEAVRAMAEEVKRHPMDQHRRGFLAELLCLDGQLERADKQLDAMSNQDPSVAVGIALFRQVIRAEVARQQFYFEGRLPEFLTPPTQQMQAHLRACVALRESDKKEAFKLLQQAEEDRIHVAGQCDGDAFEDLRDVDDRTACFMEVLTSTGKYFWVAMETLQSLEFHAPERPRDLLWRRAHMIVRDGPDGEVFLPAIYVDTGGETDESSRLGRSTHWRDEEGEPVTGVGQRIFFFGEQARPIMEITSLTFETP